MPEPVLPPLDQIDPTEAWQPWQPDAKEPWNLRWAGHLYRRAAFGAPLSELQQAVERGLPKTLDLLLNGRPETRQRDEDLRHATAEAVLRNDDSAELRGWWVYWMLYNGHPHREKMTLFWHNHFATSVVKVQRLTLMARQNETLYRHALGRFRPMLLDMSRDPAMLIWLDSNSNIRGRPNENYAREVMELFSLGVGNYTEQDIREAARAFTGWHTDGERFTFAADQHDDGPKKVLGQTGNWDGGDVIRIILEQPAAPRFLVRKLYQFFISENADPPDALLQPLADAFQKSDYDIAGLVGTMLRSRHFFSDYAYRQRIKSPVEFVLGAVHDVGHAPKTGQLLVEPRALVESLEQMGQVLFAPPNVKGWRHGKSWLNSATVLTRHNFAETLTSGQGTLTFPSKNSYSSVTVAVDPAAHARMDKRTEPQGIVALLADMLLQGDMPEAARTRLINYLAEGKPRGSNLDQRIRDAFHAVMSMPEYQLA